MKLRVTILSCYLDNAATTALSPEMKEYLTSMLDVFGNPSSAHSEGINAKRLVEEIREKIAEFIKADSSENIYFTSSGSASNALGIWGYAVANKCTILYPPTVHKSILKTIHNLADYYNTGSGILEVDSCGNVNIDYLKYALCTGCHQKLVIVDYANSEIGTIQNIKEIASVVHSRGSYCKDKIFVDCTGSVSTIPLNVTELNIDMASFSAHKLGALKGVGVLYKKNNIELAPLICGRQEQGLFAGTENVLGILSLGKAIDLMSYDKTSYNRDFVWNSIKNIEGVSLIGTPLDKNRLINNLYVCVKGVKGRDIAALMDDVYKIQISTGSACNNGSPSPSSAALAIGLSEEEANSCVRISFNGSETEDELKEFCKSFSTCIKMLRGLND